MYRHKTCERCGLPIYDFPEGDVYIDNEALFTKKFAEANKKELCTTDVRNIKDKRVVVMDLRSEGRDEFKILEMENDASYEIGTLLTLKELEKNFIKPPWWTVVIK